MRNIVNKIKLDASFKNSMFEIIKFFGVVPVAKNENLSEIDVAERKSIVESALKCGYFIDPDNINYLLKSFILSEKNRNVNTTFYRSFDDVIVKSRYELFVDQLRHYASTYGTDFPQKNGYVPNSEPESVEVNGYTLIYKKIIPCTYDELFEMCMNLFINGSKLKIETIGHIVNLMCYMYNANKDKYPIDVDKITNRDALTYFCSELNILPNDKFNLLRFIVYKYTKSSLIIKSRRAINIIKSSAQYNCFDFGLLSEKNMEDLSSIFYRFKPLFLAMKTNENAKYINKLRRLAKKYHQPLNICIGESLFAIKWNDDEIKRYAETADNFKLITLINAGNQYIAENDYVSYIIRNGNSFIKKNDIKHDIEYCKHVVDMLKAVLIERLSKNKCYISYNMYIDLACPTSEKNFIGSVPFGSSIKLDKNNYIGIYWRNEWGTHDFDLSLITENMHKVGWNGSYYSTDDCDEYGAIYSGDMTNANPEASEVVRFGKQIPDSVFYVNRYYGTENSKFMFIFGNDNDKKIKINSCQCVNTETIKVKEDCTSINKQQIIGIVYNGKFIFTGVGSGESHVSSGMYNKEIISAFGSKSENQLKVKDILTEAGFIDIDTVDEMPEDATIIDLNDLNKNKIISLFS